MKKIVFLIMFITFCVILSIICFYRKSVSCSKEITEESKYNQVLINSYLEKIKIASNDFYDEYYNKLPSVINSISIKNIILENSNSIITFTSYPYLGPHNTIGIDEITFIADYKGNIELQNFNHIVSYHLPDNLSNLEKKIIPGKYE